MIYTIKLTEEQLDNLQGLLEYVITTEEENYHEWLEEQGADTTHDHVYTTAVELSNLQFEGQ